MTLLALYVIAVGFFNYLLVPGVTLARPPWFLGLLLIGRALWQSLREGHIPRPGPFGLALMFFGITTIANGVVLLLGDGRDFGDYLRTEVQFLFILGIVFAFVRARLDEYAVARLLKVWVWTAAAAAAFGIYQSFAHVLHLPLPVLAVSARGVTKMAEKELYGFAAPSSWFVEPSWFGSYLLVPLLYVVGVLAVDPPSPFCFRKRSWAWGIAALLFLGLFLSLSQAAYATVLVVAVPVIWSLRDRILIGRVVKIAGAGVALLVVAALILSARGADVFRAQRERVAAIIAAGPRPEAAWQITSYGVRVASMRGGLELWSTSPVFGVGINSVPHHRDADRVLVNPQSGSVDSGLLQVLVEQGILGFGALMLALVILWERLARTRAHESDPGAKFLLWFLMFGLLTDVVNSGVTHPWQHPQRWLVIGLAASYLAHREGREVTTSRSPITVP